MPALLGLVDVLTFLLCLQSCGICKEVLQQCAQLCREVRPYPACNLPEVLPGTLTMHSEVLQSGQPCLFTCLCSFLGERSHCLRDCIWP